MRHRAIKLLFRKTRNPLTKNHKPRDKLQPPRIKNHGREIERALKRMGSAKNCGLLERKGEKIASRILEKHDRAQDRFDKVEGINFEARMLRLLKYRIERIEDGRLNFRRLIRQSWRPGDDPFGGWRAACRSEMDFAVVAPGQEFDFFCRSRDGPNQFFAKQGERHVGSFSVRRSSTRVDSVNRVSLQGGICPPPPPARWNQGRVA